MVRIKQILFEFLELRIPTEGDDTDQQALQKQLEFGNVLILLLLLALGGLLLHLLMGF
ncbi:hypothetical protein [Cesiribacter andamanensis]|uniref:Uncharacterized protein n=1 Tax=Cesiribacter andamanensis AMV16 TaxID=1279009 RepID=M7N215_9BACT|nr:hypothetical protein [Cesiribacter andamanensis]EMR01342.1 hypothetical protein ADICEAN_03522 [Cesiribacter andamanensis AMV16]